MNKKTNRKFSFKALLQTRKSRHLLMLLGFIALALAAVILVNVIVSLLVDRFPDAKADFTSNKAFALSDDTEEYISHMDKSVKLQIVSDEATFVNNGKYYAQAKNLLDKMVSKSDGKFSYDFINTAENPGFTRDYPKIDWSSRSTVGVIECGDEYKALSIDDCFTYNEDYYQKYQIVMWTGTTIEQAVVKGAAYVTDDDKVLVDVLTGEGESGYEALAELVTDNAYETKEVSLETGELDDDAKFALIYAPQVDISEAGAQALRDWLENGGKYGRTLIYLPTSSSTFGELRTPNLDAVLSEWGMKLNEGYTYETNTHYIWKGNPFTYIVEYTDFYFDTLQHSNVGVVSLYPYGVNITDANTAHAILQTSDQAGVFPFNADSSFNFEENVRGEAICIAAEGVKQSAEQSSRVIVFSSSAMFNDQVLAYPSFNNGTFFMNMVNTIAGKGDDTIIIQTKTLETPTMGAPTLATTNTIFIIFVLVIPGAILLTAVVLWIRRRNR